MASFQLHTDPLVSCPYNAAHRVKKSRLQIHLTKCKKNYVDLDLRECPFNAQHRIQPSEFQYHISVCPDRRLVERQIVHASNEDHHGNTTVPSYKVDMPPEEEEECWDTIPSTRPGYDPRKRLENGDLILIPKGQPVDRRNAYKKMFTASSVNSDQNSTANGYKESVDPPPEMKPIRVPRATPEVLQYSGNIGRGGQPTVRRKIAANIFGAARASDPADESNPALGHGLPGVAVGLGRGLGRGRPGVGHPPLPPGQVQYLP